jgi:hypothetical protein
MHKFRFESGLYPDSPDFHDLPWDYEFPDWAGIESRVEEIQHGISRHPVVFINFSGTLFALKELPPGIAKKEYSLLTQMQDQGIPGVRPVGSGVLHRNDQEYSILFTQHLEASIPYRSLFIGNVASRELDSLLDAISGLLVQLHTSGFYWGDCSLSNILFRRDVGALQAYLVDAETAEYHSPPLAPMLRYHDLEIMHDNISSELYALQAEESVLSNFPIQETGIYIKQRYRELWDEISREEIIRSDELYRVQERIRALNLLGFSVRDISLTNDEQGNNLKLRIFVSDRNFHRNQLMEMTGLTAEERQAQQIINEINEFRASFAHSGNPNITMEAVAYHWLEHVYKPVVDLLRQKFITKENSPPTTDMVELYCQILEHKWYLSERAHHDVGHLAATEDYIIQFSRMT